nr:zinc finger, CCHC-type [Tanacetum cinerariifolium]
SKGSNNTPNHDSVITQENLAWMEKRQQTQEKKKDQASRGRTPKHRKRGAKERKIKAAIFIFVAKELNTDENPQSRDEKIGGSMNGSLQIVASIEQYSDLDEMSLDDAIGRLETFEERHRYKNERPVNNQESLTFTRHEGQRKPSREYGQERFNQSRGRIVASIEQYSDLDEMSLDDAIGRLETFEERHRYKNERPVNNQESLMFTRHEGQRKPSREYMVKKDLTSLEAEYKTKTIINPKKKNERLLKKIQEINLK